MKLRKIFALSALAAFTFGSSAVAADNYDVILGFRTAATGDNDLIINLGDFKTSSGFLTGGLLGNFGSALASEFGANWNTRSDLYWGVAAGNTSGTRSVIFGNVNGAGYSSMTSANVSNAAIPVGNLYTASGTLSAGQSMTMLDSLSTSWTFLRSGQADGSGDAVFGVPTTKVSNSLFEQTADFASITDKSTVLMGVTGSGAWISGGSLSFSSNGDVSFSATAVPEPSTYGLMGAGALAAAAYVRRRRMAGAREVRS